MVNNILDQHKHQPLILPIPMTTIIKTNEKQRKLPPLFHVDSDVQEGLMLHLVDSSFQNILIVIMVQPAQDEVKLEDHDSNTTAH